MNGGHFMASDFIRPKDSGTLRLIAIVVGAILIRSSVRHLENSYAFLASIYAYDLVSRETGVILAVVIPVTQLVLGLMLMFFPTMRGFAYTCCVCMFCIFTVVQILTLARGLNIDCGCFGSEMRNPIGWRSIGLSFGMSLICTIAAVRFARLRLIHNDRVSDGALIR